MIPVALLIPTMSRRFMQRAWKAETGGWSSVFSHVRVLEIF
jgi:hypothetical protein